MRVNDQKASTTTLYTYDAGGNITSAKTYPYTTGAVSGAPLSQNTYTYSSSGWKDLLTNFNGDSILYDEIGNPTQYRDGMTFSWESGRQLSSVTQGDSAYSYSYDASGTRISKTVNGSTYSYIYDNGQLIYADTPSGGMTFYYENDSVVGYKLGSENYWYIKNIQGDIVGVIDKTSTLLYQYQYDAWGNPTVLDAQGNVISPDASHIANSNPLRYRGYFFDTETGFYYLLSRYYDPATCRFINADVQFSIGGDLTQINLFAYCDNNPVNRSDPSGNAWTDVVDFFKRAAEAIGNAFQSLSPAYAGAGGLALADGPLPFGDIAGAIGAAALTIGAIGVGISQAAQAPAISRPLSKKFDIDEIAKGAIKGSVIPSVPKKQAFFPANPYDFHPNGLVMYHHPGTKNGAIIEWRDPVSNIKVFEWDEDLKNSPHYHTLIIEFKGKHIGPHYNPGSPVPEPWNSIYFGG